MKQKEIIKFTEHLLSEMDWKIPHNKEVVVDMNKLEIRFEFFHQYDMLAECLFRKRFMHNKKNWSVVHDRQSDINVYVFIDLGDIREITKEDIREELMLFHEEFINCLFLIKEKEEYIYRIVNNTILEYFNDDVFYWEIDNIYPEKVKWFVELTFSIQVGKDKTHNVYQILSGIDDVKAWYNKYEENVLFVVDTEIDKLHEILKEVVNRVKLS